ncbi:hypothetical protein [Fusobacterium gastrosuis]|uniref:hypothetical protein n=1 Tax=Fusobacterium gastrosuis TaxID=1755100 RepID=UPI00297275DB|nr:hypothetical protein [Fusobacteriaceae bacterium]MDY5714294.1 hypothetical protein [Fusobacterium gastrosuis]
MKQIRKLVFIMLLFGLSISAVAGIFGGKGGSGKILKQILEYVKKDMTANVSEQLEQISRWQQQIEQWQKELAQKVGLGDLELKQTYEEWQNIYKNAQSIYNDIEQMNFKNVLDYKKFANLLLETKSYSDDPRGWEKTEEQMKDWKQKIDKMSENTAKAKDKFTGQLLGITNDKTSQERRDKAVNNAKSGGATDKQIQQKILNALASLEQLTIEQNEILASKELVAEQVKEVEKQSAEQHRQAEAKKFSDAEKAGSKEVDDNLKKFGSQGKKIGYY